MFETYNSLVSSFLQYLKFEKRYSQHTVISYENDLRQFFDFLIANYNSPSITSITTTEVRSWLAALKNDEVTARSIRRKISSLKSLYKYLMKQNLVEKSPVADVSLPKMSKRLPAFIQEDKSGDIFSNLQFSDDWQGKTEELLLQLFYATGMRVSELVNLKEQDVDASYSQLKVMGKGSKERLIPLNAKMLAQLQEYITEKPVRLPGIQNIFISEKGKPLYPRIVYNIVKKHLNAVTTLQKKSPHVLRHTFATHLANNGAELNAIKELMGHSSLAATQVYAHNTIEKLKEVFKKAHPKA